MPRGPGRRLGDLLADVTRGRARRQAPRRAPLPAVRVTYRPEADGEPDPGEVVWTWVPYEEDATQGKDRPVVVVGTWGPAYLAVVPLTSKPRPRDPNRIEVGLGRWEVEARPSYGCLDRVLAVQPTTVRREGSTLERDRFDRLVDALGRRPGWPQVPVEVVDLG